MISGTKHLQHQDGTQCRGRHRPPASESGYRMLAGAEPQPCSHPDPLWSPTPSPSHPATASPSHLMACPVVSWGQKAVALGHPSLPGAAWRHAPAVDEEHRLPKKACPGARLVARLCPRQRGSSWWPWAPPAPDPHRHLCCLRDRGHHQDAGSGCHPICPPTGVYARGRGSSAGVAELALPRETRHRDASLQFYCTRWLLQEGTGGLGKGQPCQPPSWGCQGSGVCCLFPSPARRHAQGSGDSPTVLLALLKMT